MCRERLRLGRERGLLENQSIRVLAATLGRQNQQVVRMVGILLGRAAPALSFQGRHLAMRFYTQTLTTRAWF